VGYYAHLIRGQYELLSRRQPIERLLQRDDTEVALKSRLSRALEARRFATRELGLPANGSYTQYADLGRPFAVWNVFAAPEFSLKAYEWCYILAGCLAYRGYYDLARAQEEAAQLRAEGYDVHIGGVPAYSTLGWFDDPVLNTIGGPDEVLAATIFHELAHQEVFARGDTAFNESFATFVEQEGLRRYLHDAPEVARAVEGRRRRQTQFVELMMAVRHRLERLYALGLPPDEARVRKQEEFAQLRADYEALKASWDGDRSFDGWMALDLNNASLLPFGLYHEWVPAFATLFRQAGGDWRAFYREAEALADADADQRRQRLEQLRVAGG
jgi:predicted aminopeptidase